MRPLMVLGCTSGAGKSWLVTALCRWFARQGVDVVPFKAQNMSNNARVVDGGEIGVAQWLQALAAGVEPDVRMNPVLLKPEADTRSQVVIDGRVAPEVTAMPWRERGPVLWPAMTAAFDALAAEHELVVLEGAGSPAEINLPDLVNNRMVAHADAAALLVSDIDRGGAFAHLYGTWALVPPETRGRLGGYVLNRFRGDAALLTPGPEQLTELTGMACAGVVPMLRHELPDEEGATVRADPGPGVLDVAIVRFPFGSNLDEFHLLGRAASVRFVDHPAELAGAGLVVLPGSKHVTADLAWLRERGLAAAIERVAAAGVRVLGICGGCQVLGRVVARPPRRRGRPSRRRRRPRPAAVHHRVRRGQGDAPLRGHDARRPAAGLVRTARRDARRATRSAWDGPREARCGRSTTCWRPRSMASSRTPMSSSDSSGAGPGWCWTTRSTSSPTPSTSTWTPSSCAV